MLVAVNRENLKKHSKALIRYQWNQAKERDMIRAALDPKKGNKAKLRELDQILWNHGVETIREPGVPVIHYSNSGDSYGTTFLIYKGELWIGDWGSIVETLT